MHWPACDPVPSTKPLEQMHWPLCIVLFAGHTLLSRVVMLPHTPTGPFPFLYRQSVACVS